MNFFTAYYSLTGMGYRVKYEYVSDSSETVIFTVRSNGKVVLSIFNNVVDFESSILNFLNTPKEIAKILWYGTKSIFIYKTNGGYLVESMAIIYQDLEDAVQYGVPTWRRNFLE